MKSIVQTCMRAEDFPALHAEIRFSCGMAFSPSGELHFTEYGSNQIRKINTEGKIKIVVNVSGAQGHTNDGGNPRNARLSRPHGLAFDSAGNLYSTDRDNSQFARRLTAAGVFINFITLPPTVHESTGIAMTNRYINVATNLGIMRFNMSGNHVDTITVFNFTLAGMGRDSAGNVYVATYDTSGDDSMIYKMSPSSAFTVVAGQPGRTASVAMADRPRKRV